MPSPPSVQAVRVRLVYTQADGFDAGSRFYLAYSGSPPTGANLNTLAADIANAWGTDVSPLVNVDWTLTEVDCLDLSSTSGFSGFWTGTNSGGRSGSILPANCATGIEYNIARRYRGGKPRMYLPPPVQGDMSNNTNWGSSFLSAAHTGIAAFFAAINALSIGSMGTITHSNISFYEGVYTTTPPWRGPGFKYPVKYRTVPLVDTVAGYAVKTEIASQRRRRMATTP